MTKDEFTNMINFVDKAIWEYRVQFDKIVGDYICCAFDYWKITDTEEIQKLFVELFRPNSLYGSCHGFWEDTHNMSEETQAKRHIALSLFYEICISEKLYKDF